MKTLRVLFAPVAFALLLGSGLTSSVQAEKPRKLNQSQIAEITRDGDRLADQGDYLAALTKYTEAYLAVVANIRGQDFRKPVQPQMFNREELGQEMLRLMKEEYTDEELLLMDSSYKAFGLMPRDLETKDLMAELLTEEVAGFYDPDAKRMVLIVEEGPREEPGWFRRLLGAKPAFDKDEQKTTLAHELTHALQDQLYDLNAMEKGIETDDDMLLAFSALVEGDATLLMFAEAGEQDIREMDPDAMRATFNLMSWMMPVAGGQAYRKAPPIFRESLVFPYIQGMLFALSVASQEGWSSVHAAYSNPPLSTEQILHPDKYQPGDGLDLPQAVSIPDLAAATGQGYKHLGGNCLGELQTSILFKRVSGGREAALGWDGDRYEIFQTPEGDLALVSVSIWDSAEDAKQFAKAYQDYREHASASLAQMFAEDSTRFVEQHEDRVWVVEGFPEDITQRVVQQLDGCQFQEKQFPKPVLERPAD